MKRTFTITLEEDEAQLLERLNEKFKLEHTFTSRWRQWILKRAVYAVARAMLKQGEFALPLAVDLRKETRDERDERCGRGSIEANSNWVPWVIQAAESQAAPDCIIRLDFSQPTGLFGWQ